MQAAGEVVTIPYQCNRAVIFVSDQYHESLPFRFAPGYDNRRVNLTLVRARLRVRVRVRP